MFISPIKGRIDLFGFYFFVQIFFLVIAANPTIADNRIDLSPSESAWIRQHPVVRLAGPRSFPPFHFYKKNGEAKGICHDYTLQILSELGLSIKIIPDLPWPEVLKKAADREIDLISCAAKSQDREAYLTFSIPYLSFPFVIFSQKNAPFISGLKDLHDKRVALIRKANTYNWLVRDGIQISPYFIASPLEGLQAVSLGKSDAYIGNLAAASWLIDQNGLTNLKVAAPTSYGNYELYFAARSDWPVLVSLINKALDKFSPQKHAEIRNKWLSVRYDHGIQLRDVMIWVIPTLTAAILFVLFVMMWNRRLQKEIKDRKIAQIELRESEERFRQLHEASFAGIGIHDNGIILDANHALADMTGYAFEELMGMNGLLLIAPEWREVVMESIRNHDETPYDVELIRKDKIRYPIEIAGKEIPYKGRSVRVTEFRDISRRKAAEDEREALIAELQNALENVKVLTGLVPICARCKKIRDDKGFWNQIEAYIEKHSDAMFSHGLCPDCLAEMYGNTSWFKRKLSNSTDD